MSIILLVHLGKLKINLYFLLKKLSVYGRLIETREYVCYMYNFTQVMIRILFVIIIFSNFHIVNVYKTCFIRISTQNKLHLPITGAFENSLVQIWPPYRKQTVTKQHSNNQTYKKSNNKNTYIKLEIWSYSRKKLTNTNT